MFHCQQSTEHLHSIHVLSSVIRKLGVVQVSRRHLPQLAKILWLVFGADHSPSFCEHRRGIRIGDEDSWLRYAKLVDPSLRPYEITIAGLAQHHCQRWELVESCSGDFDGQFDFEDWTLSSILTCALSE